MHTPALAFLVIDDEPQIRRVVRNAIAGEAMRASLASLQTGHEGAALPVRVLEADHGRAGIDLAAAEQPVLIVLDVGLPDMSGTEVCREVRRWSEAPIIVLSARHADTEKVALLDAGADDYLTKPFSTLELIARVRAQLRRARSTKAADAPDAALVRFGEVTIDLQLRRIERGGVLLHLTPTEWALLRTFVSNPRRTMTHHQLFGAVWGSASAGDAQQYLRVYVGHLRRKIEDDAVRPRYLQTEPGVGYRFDPDGVLPV